MSAQNLSPENRRVLECRIIWKTKLVGAIAKDSVVSVWIVSGKLVGFVLTLPLSAGMPKGTKRSQRCIDLLAA
jgi:hypothetical protein